MRKLLFTVASIVAISSASFAQKATLDNPFSLEGVLNYSGAGGIDWQAPSIRARYFVNDNIAARLQLGLGDGLGTPMSESYTFAENADGTGATGTREINRMNWMAQIGGEYHLEGTDRLSPYFMLGINFGGGSSTTTNTDIIPDGAGSYDYLSGASSEVVAKRSMFGVAAGAGLDFYVVENLYLGVELGLNYTTVNTKDAEITQTLGGVTVNQTILGNKVSSLQTGAGNVAFRLGWRF